MMFRSNVENQSHNAGSLPVSPEARSPRTCIVIPFKDPSLAKERLSEFLTSEQRRELALTLFDSTLASLSPFIGRADLLVVTNSPMIGLRAETAGAHALVESKSRGETAAIEEATRWSIARGYERQVVIPGDMARLDPADISALLDFRLAPPSVVLSPAVGDDGTNAIMTSPPDALPFRFGKASFPEYLLRAAELGVQARVLRLKSLVLDIDTPEDLRHFMKDQLGSPAQRLLMSWGIEELVTA